jgi:hydroxyethylthiazole kinase-like uncharacterized protein yjeF
MQLLADANQMQGFDREAIGTYSIPGLLLMENAGRAFTDELQRSCGSLRGKHVLVICGKGNNGGDGFVIARHLINRGAEVSVLLLGGRRQVKGDAAANLKIILAISQRQKAPLTFLELRSERQLRRIGKPEIIVDAIFGTGFSGSVGGVYGKVVEWINRRGSYVASVDIPSGVNASSGVVENLAVRASLTVSMGLAKTGHYVGAGRDHSGTVVTVDISIPQFLYRAAPKQTYRVVGPDVRAALPGRQRTAHKYSVGKVFLLAGSRSFTGAPYMTAQSVLRIGAGAVIVGIPRSIHAILARKVTEVILQPLEETAEGTVARSAIEVIREKIRWADVVAVGPGMSRSAETDQLILALVKEIDKPLVLDADGLNALAGVSAVLRKRKAPTILTPHAGELSRLTGVSSAAIERDRISSAREAARLLQSIVALKGSPTVTAAPGGTAFVNSSGNPGMATIGSGDVLTGIIAGLCAQGMDPVSATWGGVFIHGRAGDASAGRLGQRGLLALDILEAIPEATQQLGAE